MFLLDNVTEDLRCHEYDAHVLPSCKKKQTIINDSSRCRFKQNKHGSRALGCHGYGALKYEKSAISESRTACSKGLKNNVFLLFFQMMMQVPKVAKAFKKH